jgi:hypothetical protein
MRAFPVSARVPALSGAAFAVGAVPFLRRAVASSDDVAASGGGFFLRAVVHAASVFFLADPQMATDGNTSCGLMP